MHRNDPLYSDREICGNSVDPDQTAPDILWAAFGYIIILLNHTNESNNFFKYQNFSNFLWYRNELFLSFWTDRSGQTVQIQIRLFLEVQSDQALHCLPYSLQGWMQDFGKGASFLTILSKNVKFIIFHQNPHENEIVLAKSGVRAILLNPLWIRPRSACFGHIILQ